MEWQGIVTLITLFSVLSALALTRVSADLILMAALAFLLITGILGQRKRWRGLVIRASSQLQRFTLLQPG